MSEITAPAVSGQGAPAAGATTGVTQTSDTTSSVTSQDWTTGLPDELRGYVQTKGFKDPTSVVDSYKNLEKLMGAPKERLLKLPEKSDDATGWNEIYNRLGRPEKADDYKIDIPKEVGDENFAKWAKELFHENGLTRAQGEKIAAKWNEYLQSTAKETVEKHNANITQQETELKKEWGMAFDKNIEMARRAASEFGLDAPTIDKLESAMGWSGVIKFMHNVGSKLGEHSFVSNNQQQGFNVMTPEAAKHRIQLLKSDSDFAKRFMTGEIQAKEEMARLHQMAYPD